ncbi:hypothetical protein WG66_014714 [Moniliophthora roreri]|nr:hypothetical protein WG66_014714 [Moniliophthora roreri]
MISIAHGTFRLQPIVTRLVPAVLKEEKPICQISRTRDTVSQRYSRLSDQVKPLTLSSLPA